jgi:AhpD family alkylhydroperoxidase
MAESPRKMLEAFTNGLGAFSTADASKDTTAAFMGMLGADYAEGAISTKNKELISVGIACFSRCVYCIVYHTYKAFESGATRDEILQAAMVSVAFGGGPAMAYSATILKDSLDEFEGDFK